MNRKFNPAISIIRVAAMISIIVGHWLSMQGINHFQFGAIGVEIFFFISGYLYSEKKIDNIKGWIYNRWKRIILPYWIVLGGVIILRSSFGYEVSPNAVIVFFFNLQGLDKIFRNVSMPILKGMGQTWFLTVLVICYIIMLFLKRNQKVEKVIRNNTKIAFFCTIVLQIVLSFWGIQIIRPLCFFYGYFWDKSKLNLSDKKYGFLTSLMVLFTLIRFVTHILYDGSVLYDYIIFGWSFVILALWLIVSAFKFLNYISSIVKKIVANKAWKFLDLLTYPLFLTHYMFASGEFAVINWIDVLVGQIIAFIILTCLSGVLILMLTDYKNVKKVIEEV